MSSFYEIEKKGQTILITLTSFQAFSVPTIVFIVHIYYLHIYFVDDSLSVMEC